MHLCALVYGSQRRVSEPLDLDCDEPVWDSRKGTRSFVRTVSPPYCRAISPVLALSFYRISVYSQPGSLNPPGGTAAQSLTAREQDED